MAALLNEKSASMPDSEEKARVNQAAKQPSLQTEAKSNIAGYSGNLPPYIQRKIQRSYNTFATSLGVFFGASSYEPIEEIEMEDLIVQLESLTLNEGEKDAGKTG